MLYVRLSLYLLFIYHIGTTSHRRVHCTSFSKIPNSRVSNLNLSRIVFGFFYGGVSGYAGGVCAISRYLTLFSRLALTFFNFRGDINLYGINRGFLTGYSQERSVFGQCSRKYTGNMGRCDTLEALGSSTCDKVIKDTKSFVSQSNPPFIKTRLALFEELYRKQQDEVDKLEKSSIKISFEPCKDVAPVDVDGKAHLTTPLDIVKLVAKELVSRAIVVEVLPETRICEHDIVDVDQLDPQDQDDWILWDLQRPLEMSCRMRILDFESSRGKHVFWHSSAHMLGSALEETLGGYVTIGPALQDGFYYDCYLGDKTLTPEDMTIIAESVSKLAKSKSPFQRLVCTKSQALELMRHNPFKVELIKKKVQDGAKTVCYRCGNFVDLCKGPHIPFTSILDPYGFKITKFSSCYWLSKATSDSLQRVYGISFPSEKQLVEYEKMIQETKQRDHRIIGTNLGLFHFDNINSPGSCFWMPNGAKIYNRLVEFMRENYRLRGYQEVITPNIYSCELWKKSGHYDNYMENMYVFSVDDAEWGMKAMNCPGHCLMFKHMSPSYRQLPLRFADFGVLHRNELSGSLSGLTRVRRFQQDDAHIFCAKEQVFDEVMELLKFANEVYSMFDFKCLFKLSTRPEKALGDDELWKVAEKALEKALNATGKPWTLNPGDGAFYGPKIDIVLFDCLGREHQCGTVQLDFNLPVRFSLEYHDKTVDQPLPDEAELPESAPEGVRRGFQRPVMIHRAIFGSIERFVAILLEQTSGKLPFWLSPTQVIMVPVSDKHIEYAEKVLKLLLHKGVNAAIDKSSNTINKKIKMGQAQRWNYIAVVGDKELQSETVSIRPLDTQQQLVLGIDDFIRRLAEEMEEYKTKISCFKL